MNDIPQLFQAFLAPALFVSATALLVLSINVRLMGIVSRLRQFVHAKYDAARNGRMQEADAYTSQINAIERRAELIRRCFLLALVALAGTTASWPAAGPRTLLEGRSGGGSGAVRGSPDLPAGGNGLLPAGGDRGAEFRARRGARLTIYGPGGASGDSRTPPAVKGGYGLQACRDLAGQQAVTPASKR